MGLFIGRLSLPGNLGVVPLPVPFPEAQVDNVDSHLVSSAC